MQYFISTFIIMLICIIALLQDKSYDAGAVLSRPQNRVPDPKKNPLIKCNNVSHADLKVSPQLFVDKNESQIEVFAALLAEKFINPSILNKTIVTSAKASSATNSSGEKCLAKEANFCFRCNFSSFATEYEHFKHPIKALHNQ
ncbi:MAG TPA: hypothetical protein VF455_03085 [Chryseobacterium sp.]